MPRLIACVFIVSLAASARADSEGYFCHTPDYLAYETRWADGFPGASGTHQLHIVRFGADGAFREALSLDIAEFQAHGLRCERSGVILLAWLSTHRVALGRDGAVEYRGESPLPAGCIADDRPTLRAGGCELPEFGGRNLGHLAEPGRHVLRPDAGEGAVELVIEQAEAGAPGVVHRATRSALVKRDRRGEEVARRAIFDAAFMEPID